jgi:microsomal dipeptidase-like Zn-dependent dipeptidase
MLSVLYRPFCEMDLSKRYGAPPDPGYLPALLRQLELVEQNVGEQFASEAGIAHSADELESLLEERRTALVHCVEGAFHLGPTPDAVDRAVTQLAARGIAYITLAHLFWRSVATNSNAIPFLSDRLYRLIFPQPDVGLTDLGKAAVRAMVREHVLIDLSHMDQNALDATFGLLEEIDPGRATPVVATHVAYRFGDQAYNLDEETVRIIAGRDGVAGLILAEHQASDGVRRKRTASLEDSLSVLFRHIDRIRDITGSHRHVAIGSDLDGYIKPTLAGLENMAHMAHLEAALVARYGQDDADLIAGGNIMRLLRTYWGRADRPADAGSEIATAHGASG